MQKLYVDTRTNNMVIVLQELSDRTVMVKRLRDNRRYIVPKNELKPAVLKRG